ncbi:MAG: hypothetical protein FJX68_04265 [Alphaproteobacteria bacterium]|nr:hypothetical protein [Alphaproteobacteria bacterium]
MLDPPLLFLARHAALALAVSVFLGLALPPLASLLRLLLLPVIVLLLALALLRLDLGRFLGYARRPVLLVGFVVVKQLGTPLLTFALLKWLQAPDALILGLVLMAAAPTVTGAPAFAAIMGLDVAFATAGVLAVQIIVPFTLPFLALELLGLELKLGAVELMLRLSLLVAAGFALSQALQRTVLNPVRVAQLGRRLDGLMVLCLGTFAIGIMAGMQEVALRQPGFALLLTVGAYLGNLGLQLLGVLLFANAGRGVALTAGHMLGNCNMGLVLAALGDDAPFAVSAFFAFAQLPMYTLPVMLLPLYRRLLGTTTA